MADENYTERVEAYIEKYNSELGSETAEHLRALLAGHRPQSEKDLEHWMYAVKHHITTSGRFEAE